MGAGSALLCWAQGLGCLPGGVQPCRTPSAALPTIGGTGSPPRGQWDAVGYKPMGFGVLPQAGVGRLSSITHPWLLPSPGTSWPSRLCRRCPPTSPGTPILSSIWSKHSSTATGRGDGDPALASGVQGGPAQALAKESSPLGWAEGSRGAWAGPGSRDVLQRVSCAHPRSVGFYSPPVLP